MTKKRIGKTGSGFCSYWASHPALPLARMVSQRSPEVAREHNALKLGSLSWPTPAYSLELMETLCATKKQT